MKLSSRGESLAVQRLHDTWASRKGGGRGGGDCSEVKVDGVSEIVQCF